MLSLVFLLSECERLYRSDRAALRADLVVWWFFVSGGGGLPLWILHTGVSVFPEHILQVTEMLGTNAEDTQANLARGFTTGHRLMLELETDSEPSWMAGLSQVWPFSHQIWATPPLLPGDLHCGAMPVWQQTWRTSEMETVTDTEVYTITKLLY